MSRSLVFWSLVLAAGPSPYSFAAPPEGGPGEKIAPEEALAFEVKVVPADPFHPVYQAGSGAEKLKVRRGEMVRVEITGKLAGGYHTYPITKRTATQPESQLSQLKIGAIKGIKPLWPLGESEPQVVKNVKLNETFLEHTRTFVWRQDVLVTEDAAPGMVEIPIHLAFQVCDATKCTPPLSREQSAQFEISVEPPLDLTAEVKSRLANPSPSPEVVNVPGEAPPPSAAARPAENAALHESVRGLISASHSQYKARMEELAREIKAESVAAQDNDLLSFLLAGVFWGAVSLITPCVFPMIPITVSYFLKQSEKEHHRPIVMASVYSLTIVVVLTLAAAFLLSVFRWLSINPVMNYALGGLFVFFALSLFGMYEIELPSGLARFTSSREGKGGLAGTMFMALTFTIISFACVAPFLGGFGGTAAASRPLWHNLLGGLAFSATFAAPFFVLALFPVLLRSLPKSGSWLNSVKVVMGFLELAAAFKFFRAAELVQSGGTPSLFTFDLVLGIWVALCFLCGLYLIGLYNLPHDSPSENVSVPRMLFSAAFVGLGFYLMPALFKTEGGTASQRPGGAVYAWVDSFLLPESGGESGHGFPRTGNLDWAVADAREHRKRTGQPKRIFIDFTGFS